MDRGREGIGHAADLVKGREIAGNLRSRSKFPSPISCYDYYPLFFFKFYVFQAELLTVERKKKRKEKGAQANSGVVSYFRD